MLSNVYFARKTVTNPDDYFIMTKIRNTDLFEKYKYLLKKQKILPWNCN